MTETMYEQMLTIAEMEERFDGEWILLEDPFLNERHQIAGGRLIAHSKNRDEVDEAAMRLRLKHGAFLYMGPMPENIAINL